MNLDRRHFLRVGAVSTAVDVRLDRPLAHAAEETKTKPKRSCILLWMNGGPSTIDLWDLKPGHENGGPYKEIEARARPQDRRTPAEARQARQVASRSSAACPPRKATTAAAPT